MGEALVADSRDRQSTPLSRRERIVTWISGGLFLGAAIPMAVMVPSDRSPSLAATVAVITVYAVLSRVKFEVGSGWAVPTELVLVPMLFVFPPGSVPIFVALSYALAYLPDYLRGRTHGERAAVVLSDSWFAVGPALVFVLAGEPTASLAVWPILIAAVAAQFTLDIASSTAREWLAFRVRPGVLLGPMGWIFMVDVLLAPVGFLAALADTDNPAAYLLALPLAGLLAIFSRDRQVRIDQTLELSKTYRGTAFLLGDVVEADDDYTGLHSRDVVELVLEVCEELGLDGRERRRAEFAALLHDVGKIRIPKEIINKTGTLSAEERELMETHTIEGQRVLDRVGGVLSEIGSIVRSCHERFDGQGYPDGLAGDEIPILARIICCCDAFSAMTTDRSYRAARSLSAAIVELRQHAGTQFDPEVAEALARVVLRRASLVVEHEAGEIAGRNPSPIAGTRTIPLWRDDKPPVPTDDDPEVSSTAATRSAHAQSEGEARLAGSFGSSARVDARSDRPRRLHLRNSLVGDDLRARQAPSVENEHIKSSETNEPGASRSSEGARLAPVVVPVTLVGVGVGALAVWSLASSPPTIFGFIGIVALLLAATCAEALPVPIQNVQADGASMAAVFLVGTAVIFGWEASALASALTQVFLASRLRRRAARSAYNAAMYGLSGAAAGAAASAIAHTGSTVSSTVLGVIAASASFYAVNVALVTLVVARSSGEPLGSVLRRAVPITAVIFAIMTSAILMLVILWQRSPLLLIVLIGPLLAIGLYQRSLRSGLQGNAARADGSPHRARKLAPFPGASASARGERRRTG